MTNEEMAQYIAGIQAGPLLDRYKIYLEFCGDKYPLTFDQWLNK